MHSGKIISSVISILIVLASFSAKQTEAQQTNVWYFGYNAGIDFNNGSTVFLPGGQTYQWEGVSSISDSDGNLLFYTDGIQIWDKNSNIMPNGTGLQGDYSTTQSALIVPLPGSDSLYYVFTLDDMGGPNGLKYSIVDMSLNGGLGDVSALNIAVYAPSSEKLTGVMHRNGKDIWIISHEMNSNNYRCDLLTAAGLSPTPVISSVGSVLSATLGMSGYLKASPSGCKLASAVMYGYLELYDFDNSTGMVSNAIYFGNDYLRAYGVEFSPDSKKLYLAAMGDNSTNIPSRAFQFDLTLGSAGAIIASGVTLASYSGQYQNGGMQLGPDGKIYCARNNQPFLDVIESPNQTGTACNYSSQAFTLSSGTSGLGFPNFVQNFLLPEIAISHTDTCLGIPSSFSISDTSSIDSISWNFDDPNSGNQNTSSQLNPGHQFTSSGSYQITTIVQYGCIVDTLLDTLTILSPPQVSLPGDTTFPCTAGSVLLHVSPDGNILWQNGSTDTSLLASSPGLYWVQVTNSCGVASDSFYLSITNLPQLNIGNDTTLCDQSELTLHGGGNNASNIWNDGSTVDTFLVTAPGTYWVTSFFDSTCATSDTITVGYDYTPDFDLPVDTTLCIGDKLLLEFPDSLGNFTWFDGSQLNEIVITEPEEVWLTVYNECGQHFDSTNVTFKQCSCNLWMPTAFSPNGDGVNDYFHPITYCPVAHFDMKVFNRWGQLIFESTDINFGWDGQYHSAPSDIGVYDWMVSYLPNGKTQDVLLKGNVTLIR